MARKIICKQCGKDLTAAYCALVDNSMSSVMFLVIHVLAHLGYSFEDYFEVVEQEEHPISDVIKEMKGVD